MAAYTSTTRYGPPTGGVYVAGDTFTDAGGTIFQCTEGGFDAKWTAAPTGLSPTETAVLDGVTPGTVAANKAVVAGASNNIDALTITTMTGDVVGDVTGNVAGDVTGNVAGDLTGIAANLTTIATGNTVSVPTNTQTAIFGTLTVDGTLTVGGELRVCAWPS